MSYNLLITGSKSRIWMEAGPTNFKGKITFNHVVRDILLKWNFQSMQRYLSNSCRSGLNANLVKKIMKVAQVRALQGNWMKITKAWWRHTLPQKCTNLNDNQSCRILAKHRLKYLKEYFETCSKLSLTDPVTNSEMLVQCAPKNGKHVNAFECTSPKLSCAMTQSAKLQFSAVLADWLSESILNLTTGINPDTFTKWTKKPCQTVFD